MHRVVERRGTGTGGVRPVSGVAPRHPGQLPLLVVSPSRPPTPPRDSGHQNKYWGVGWGGYGETRYFGVLEFSGLLSRPVFGVNCLPLLLRGSPSPFSPVPGASTVSFNPFRVSMGGSVAGGGGVSPGSSGGSATVPFVVRLLKGFGGSCWGRVPRVPPPVSTGRSSPGSGRLLESRGRRRTPLLPPFPFSLRLTD